MAGEGEKGEGKSFKVEDRRRFSPETGEPRDATGGEETSKGVGEQTASEGPSERATDESFSEINFSTFVISLSTQALMHLGEIPNPLSGKVESDIPVAKQMIDIIGLLREKTRGNLDRGEEKLINDVLFDLRMKYVETVKRK
ncbi:MAG: DUF1844 domain-containing protein [Candidatus Binatia bacterium]